jgi:hypothetical protein
MDVFVAMILAADFKRRTHEGVWCQRQAKVRRQSTVVWAGSWCRSTLQYEIISPFVVMTHVPGQWIKKSALDGRSLGLWFVAATNPAITNNNAHRKAISETHPYSIVKPLLPLDRNRRKRVARSAVKSGLIPNTVIYLFEEGMP